MVLAENTLLAYNPEATYAAYTETGQVAVMAESLTPKFDPTLAERNDMEGDIFPQVALTTRKNIKVGWKTKLFPGNEIGYLLRTMLGAPSTSTVNSTGKKHIFTLTEAGLADKSLCCEISHGGLTADNYDGLMFDNIKFSGGSDGFVTVEISGQAQGRGAGTKMSPVVITSLLPAKYSNAVVSYGGSTVKCDSWDIELPLALLLENFKSGTDEIEKPVTNGRPAPKASFTCDLADLTNRATYEAGTATANFKVTISFPDNIAGSSPTIPYSLVLELPATQINDYSITGETGQMKQQINLTGYAGTSTAGSATTNFEAVLTNLTASYA